jgi:peptide chain release factor 1
MERISPDIAEKLAGRLAKLAARRAELESMMADPAAIADTARYAGLGKEYGSLGEAARLHHELGAARSARHEAEELLAEQATDEEMRQLAREEAQAADAREQEVLSRAVDLLCADAKDEDRNVVMEIRSGTGGDEAALFAADLLGMYQHYCQRRGWRVELLDSSENDLGGLKEVILLIRGKGVWRKLRYESGGHRVQRVPETESQGRIHTSLATIAVLPEAEEVDVELKPEDLEVSFMRSSGPGGQNVNKVSSCVRLVHKPTGIMVKCQVEKSQHKNRRLAEKILRSRLMEEQQRSTKGRRDALRRSQVGTGDRNERIRTYNFPQDRITDHRIGLDVFGIQNVLMGNCDPIFDALAEWDRQARVRTLLESDGENGAHGR